MVCNFSNVLVKKVHNVDEFVGEKCTSWYINSNVVHNVSILLVKRCTILMNFAVKKVHNVY